ncbi:MAG: cation transporter, partial [Acidobacteria bacterium]|nr:cation transporter [Acidobacteriota bacterium]
MCATAHDGYAGASALRREGRAIREQKEFRVAGLDCTEEASLIRRELDGRAGVHGVSFNVVDGRMTVD